MLDDASLTKLLRRCQQLPGQALFQYLDDDGARAAGGLGEVNGYLREAMGEEFHREGFPHLGRHARAFQLLARRCRSASRCERTRTGCPRETCAERGLANMLGNTPSVCRKAYVDPAVFAGWRDGRLQRATVGVARRAAGDGKQAALKFLRRRADGQEARAPRGRQEPVPPDVQRSPPLRQVSLSQAAKHSVL